MTALKPAAYLSATTAVRALNGLVVIKLIALASDPATFGRISQIMGVIALTSMLAAGSIGNGLSRQLAASGSTQERQRWLAASSRIYVAVSIILAAVLLASSLSLSRWLVGDSTYLWVFLALAILQAAAGAWNLAYAIAAASGRFGFILAVTASSAAIGAVAVALGLQFGGPLGGALALVLNAALPGIVASASNTTVIVRQWQRRHETSPSAADIKRLLSFSAVVILGAGSLALSQIAGRQLVGDTLGWHAVGQWQTVSRLSDVYMQFFSVVLMSYALPRLSAMKGYRLMNPAWLRLSRTFVLAALVAVTIIYFGAAFIIELLFSKAYVSAAALLPAQLLGDVFRVAAVCLSVGMLSQGETRVSMVYEAAQGALSYGLLWALLPKFGSLAPVWAHCATYAVLCLGLAVLYRQRLGQEVRA